MLMNEFNFQIECRDLFSIFGLPYLSQSMSSLIYRIAHIFHVTHTELSNILRKTYSYLRDLILIIYHIPIFQTCAQYFGLLKSPDQIPGHIYGNLKLFVSMFFISISIYCRPWSKYAKCCCCFLFS